jgi:hypothetical protein
LIVQIGIASVSHIGQALCIAQRLLLFQRPQLKMLIDAGREIFSIPLRASSCDYKEISIYLCCIDKKVGDGVHQAFAYDRRGHFVEAIEHKQPWP